MTSGLHLANVVIPAEFMYMTRMAAAGHAEIHLYKHIYSRRYLNLDDAGHAYQFLGVAAYEPPDPPLAFYRAWRDARSAIEHLELGLFGDVSSSRFTPP